MTTPLNKKVLCFVDEYGTAGTGTFSLGAVVVLAIPAALWLLPRIFGPAFASGRFAVAMLRVSTDVEAKRHTD